MIARNNSKTPSIVMPISRNGSSSNHTIGYRISAKRANGQHKTSRMHHSRNLIIGATFSWWLHATNVYTQPATRVFHRSTALYTRSYFTRENLPGKVASVCGWVIIRGVIAGAADPTWPMAEQSSTSLTKLVAEHGKAALGSFTRRLVLNHIPVLYEDSILDSKNVRCDPVRGQAEIRESSVHDHHLAALNAISPGNLVGETFVTVSGTAPLLRVVNRRLPEAVRNQYQASSRGGPPRYGNVLNSVGARRRAVTCLRTELSSSVRNEFVLSREIGRLSMWSSATKSRTTPPSRSFCFRDWTS